MNRTGNSNVDTCVQNLLRLERGEIPLDQMRGIRAGITDMPSTQAVLLLQGSAYTCIECYEPRTNFGSLAVSWGNKEGNFKTTATL